MLFRSPRQTRQWLEDDALEGDETEHALDVLTRGGLSRSAAIRQAVLEAASRRERAAQMRRDVLRMGLGQPDGVNIAEELARDRSEVG